MEGKAIVFTTSNRARRRRHRKVWSLCSLTLCLAPTAFGQDASPGKDAQPAHNAASVQESSRTLTMPDVTSPSDLGLAATAPHHLPDGDIGKRLDSTSEPAGVKVTDPPVGSRPQSIEEALDRKGSVTFRKTPLSEVVFLLSELWQINIVAGENVAGEVSGAFHDAPLREVLSAALTATGYSYRQTGASLIVLPIDQVGADDPNFVSETIRLPSLGPDADTTIEAAQMLLGQRGQLQRVGVNSVLVIDTTERVRRIRQLFEEIAGPNVSERGSTLATAPGTPVATTETDATPSPPPTEMVVRSGIAYFTPQFTEAAEMAEPLQAALGDQVVVAVYPEENRLMIKGTAEQLQLARDAIGQLDVPRQQVRITAMIYDVGISELEELGVNVTHDLRAVANVRNEALADVSGTVNSLFVFTSNLANGGATQAGIRTITDTFEASALLEALDATSEAKLLADPSITVGDRRAASIRIVRKIPIVGANPVENSNAVFTQTEFEEAGVILQVQPRISRDGTIELKVTPEYSVVAEITESGPVIDSRTADTTVRVGDGQMFVLGGLRQKSIVASVRGIPFLKDIKYLGALFRSHSAEVRESELIVFLKPELVSPYSCGKPREMKAAQVSQCELDAIPYATHCPQTPNCKDPYCPYHYPRRRINGGTRELEMLGGAGIEPAIHGGTMSEPEMLLRPGNITEPGASGGVPQRHLPTPGDPVPSIPVQARPEVEPALLPAVVPAPAVTPAVSVTPPTTQVGGYPEGFAPVRVAPTSFTVTR